MLHNCHETFLQPHAINYHNLISALCKKLRISDGDRADRRGSRAQLAEGAGRHATSKPDGQNSTVVQPDSPTTKAWGQGLGRRLGTRFAIAASPVFGGLSRGAKFPRARETPSRTGPQRISNRQGTRRGSILFALPVLDESQLHR